MASIEITGVSRQKLLPKVTRKYFAGGERTNTTQGRNVKLAHAQIIDLSLGCV